MLNLNGFRIYKDFDKCVFYRGDKDRSLNDDAVDDSTANHDSAKVVPSVQKLGLGIAATFALSLLTKTLICKTKQ